MSQPLSYYVRVSYATLKRRAKQLAVAPSKFGWQFDQAVVAKESGFSYTAGNPSGAYGLFQINRATASYLGVPYASMQASVTLQVKAGQKLLNLNYKMIAAAAPEFIAAGGTDLWALAYHAHNQGLFGTQALLKKMRARGLPMTWSSFVTLAPLRSRVQVSDEVAGMVDAWQDRYAELVQDQTAVAQYEFGEGPDEDDGQELPVPAHLADPNWTEASLPTARLILGLAALGAATAGFCYWYDRRRTA